MVLLPWAAIAENSGYPWAFCGAAELYGKYGIKLAAIANTSIQLVLVSGPSGPALPRKIALSALAKRPLVLPGKDHGLRRIIDDACAPLKVQLNVVAEIESLGSVKRAVEAGIGDTILQQGAVAEEVAVGRLRTALLNSPAMTRRVVCATSTTRPATRASQAVGELVQEVVHQMVRSGTWPARWIGDTPQRKSGR